MSDKMNQMREMLGVTEDYKDEQIKVMKRDLSHAQDIIDAITKQRNMLANREAELLAGLAAASRDNAGLQKQIEGLSAQKAANEKVEPATP